MNIHLKIWIPGLLSFFTFLIYKGLQLHPGPRIEVQPTFWFFVTLILQLLAAWYAYKLLKIKNRSGTWIGLVVVIGLLGIIIVELLPAKKIIPPPVSV